MMDARQLCAALALGACVLAACSSDAVSTAPTVELSTTTVTTLPSTTATTEAPTTTEDPRIAEVEAAVAAYREAQVRVLTDPTEEIEQLAEFATGPVLASNSELVRQIRADGRTISGDFPFVPVSTSLVSDSEASHIQCGRDELASFDAGGELIVPADSAAFLRSYAVQLGDDGKWRVEIVEFPGRERTTCEL